MPDWKAEIRRRLQSLQLTPTRESAIIEELSQYLDDCYDVLLASGATEAEAYHQTLMELSGSELLRRELRRAERLVPQESLVLGTNRRTNMIVDMWQDLRYGARMLLKQPGFTLIAVLQPVSKRDQVVAAFKDAILRGETQPDDAIVESRVAQQPGAGVPLVSEALIELEHRGYVQKAPFLGNYEYSWNPLRCGRYSVCADRRQMEPSVRF